MIIQSPIEGKKIDLTITSKSSYRQDGYDPYCKAAFRAYLASYYNGSIEALNNIWSSSYTTFDEVQMPTSYNRNSASWADLIQWRENSIAGFLAAGAAKVREADPNHM